MGSASNLHGNQAGLVCLGLAAQPTKESSSTGSSKPGQQSVFAQLGVVSWSGVRLSWWHAGVFVMSGRRVGQGRARKSSHSLVTICALMAKATCLALSGLESGEGRERGRFGAVKGQGAGCPRHRRSWEVMGAGSPS